MDKEKYYINVASGEISRNKTASSWHFEIEATAEEIKHLRELFRTMDSANLQSFVRSHIPFLEYHVDPENDIYDSGIIQVYKMIYQLGNQETKQQIREMGILFGGNDHL
ncbi:hydrolase [Caldibacillus lycopersici]|uniref:Hydrolase n=1 Tax=Perspicuibacillus lycopersici TaxID=1325689 RepID=A0AAE3LN49_9BACI|nr:hydrolase [Perspicuibacillus lycopersici]MCU9614290.1 hydrolase [Perspicuibacillus lycopersici]